MPPKDWSRYGIEEKHTKPKAPKVFDSIIIGAGPAGMTAAVYGSRRKLKLLLISGHQIGGQMLWASDIENYTGIKKITGPALTERFYHHLKKIEHDYEHFDFWLHEHEAVTHVEKKGALFLVHTEEGEVFSAKTLIIAAGKKPRTLGVPGEAMAMKGNGLSFSTTSDAPLYKEKKVAVIGGGNSALDISLQLEKFTTDITLFTDLDHLIGEQVLIEKVKKSPHIEVKYNIAVQEILLNPCHKVCGILYREKNEKSQKFECEGIFEGIGHMPTTDFLQGFLALNPRGEIVTDRKCRTSVSGVFAAGDITEEVHKQVIVAAGQGAIAALEVHEYLQLQKNQT